MKLRAVVLTRKLSHPWSLVFLPDRSMLITEREGRVRVFRDGLLDPKPIGGVPKVLAQSRTGLMDIALHPRFAENQLVYLSYTKPDSKRFMTTALARGRWDGKNLVETRDIFIADAYGEAGSAASRVVFGNDNMLYMTIGGVFDDRAQNPGSDCGKVVRLRDDGTIPPDDPMIGKPGFKPAIFSLGHRNGLGLAIHPQTGEIWEAEQGPNGGDEINVLLPGRNYGWPVVSYGRNYNGLSLGHAWKEGIEEPLLFWTPSIAVSGMTFYTGNKFPEWKGNVFVGSLRTGEIPGTGHLERIVFNEKSEELRRESLLVDLHQRIRDVRQGPDGLLYVITDEDAGALIRLEPVEDQSATR